MLFVLISIINARQPACMQLSIASLLCITQSEQGVQNSSACFSENFCVTLPCAKPMELRKRVFFLFVFLFFFLIDSFGSNFGGKKKWCGFREITGCPSSKGFRNCLISYV